MMTLTTAVKKRKYEEYERKRMFPYGCQFLCFLLRKQLQGMFGVKRA